MPPRLSLDTLESLHLTLHKLEQASSSVEDQQAMADLKRIILNRIGELEVLQALGPKETVDEAAATQPADLIPPPVATEQDYVAPSPDSADLEKLD